MPNIDADALNNPAVNFENRSTDPAAPGSGRAKLYVKNGGVYVRLDTGDPASVGGAVALAEGRLAIGSAGGTLSALALGTEGQLVTANASGHAAWANAAPGGSGALTKIATRVVPAGGETSYTFSAISGSYSALRLDGVGRVDTNALADYIYARCNGDSAANYDSAIFYIAINGTNAVSGGVGETMAKVGILSAANAPSNAVGTFSLVLPQYANTAWLKNGDTVGTSVQGTTATTIFQLSGHAYWRSTAAITSLTVLASGTVKMLEGTVLTLYGVS